MSVPQPLRKIVETTVLVALLIIPSHGLNVGLIAGDNKRLSSPLIIRKVSKLSPVFIKINSGLPNIIKSLQALPKLPPKPPPSRLSESKLPKPKRSILSPVPPLFLPPLILPLPILPLLPILPPFLPRLPIIPRLPKIPPLPTIPPLSLHKLKSPKEPLRLPPLSLHKLKSPKEPLRLPILDKPPLKTLGPKEKPVNLNRDILAKLIDLRVKGSLTTSEFIKFKKLLIVK